LSIMVTASNHACQISPAHRCHRVANHRDLAMRIPVSSQKNRRVEHRVAGADACPYLVVASVMAGIHHGITNQLDPGPMVAEKQKINYEVTLPVRWSKALDVFHAQVSNRDYEWYMRAV